MSKATLARSTAPRAEVGRRGRRKGRTERVRRRRREEKRRARGEELEEEGEEAVTGNPPVREESKVPMPRRRRVLFSFAGGRRAMERGGMRGRAGEIFGKEEMSGQLQPGLGRGEDGRRPLDGQERASREDKSRATAGEEEAREILAARKPRLVREEGSGVSHQENFARRRIVSRRERMERPRAAGRGEMRW